MALGYAQFDKQQIIEHCQKSIAEICDSRKKREQKILQDILKRQLSCRQHLWMWFKCQKPNEETALREYHNDGSLFPPAFCVAMCYGKKEEVCEKILKLAENCSGNILWLSDKSAQIFQKVET